MYRSDCPKDQTGKAKSTYSGKTYNSSDAINAFFSKKKGETPKTDAPISQSAPKKSGFDKLKEFASKEKPAGAAPPAGKFLPGAHVRHAKYGKGLVLRREGSGDNTKLTVSFPGFGQKKLIEKFAKLESA